MKSYRWITLIAALVITVCEILVFESQAAQTPQRQASVGPPQTLRAASIRPASSGGEW